MRKLSPIIALALSAISPVAADEGTRLLRHPTLSESRIAFAYANDLWVADRDGGEARRLTVFPGSESSPTFSPDGEWIAFSGEYDGNVDVYVVSVDGGTPRRLTWHPAPDSPIGWSPDGSEVLFLSTRDDAPILMGRYWRVSVDGGLPTALAIPRGSVGSLSPDGGRLAYEPYVRWDREWRNYRGGQAAPIWVVDLESYELTKSPQDADGSDNTDPVWLGDTVYFLSDRDYVKNVYAWTPGSDSVEQVTFHKVFDAKNLTAGGGRLTYEAGGYLHAWDPAGGSRQLAFEVVGDLPWTRAQWEEVGDAVRQAALSPTGQRAVFEARGEIFTVPTDKGNWRNLTRSSGSAERAPAWSPDGRWISWFSDSGGEYALVISDQKGLEEPRTIALESPTFYFTPSWSPDSKSLTYTDEEIRLWHLDVESGEQTLVDTDAFAHPERTMDPVWSPDSKWIAYAKRLDNQYHAIFVYSTADGTTHQITDSLSDVISPAWDASGKYLWFLGSTNYSVSSGWLDLSSIEHEVRRELYFAVLGADTPSPLLPESDEEPVEEESEAESETDESDDEGDDAEEDDAPEVKIDFDGLRDRILSVSMPSRPYVRVKAGPEGVVFVTERVPNERTLTLHKYSFEEREAEEFATGVGGWVVSADGSHLLYASGGGWHVVETGSKPSAGDGALDMSLRARIDPRAEWRQMFREAWRYQRDFFYVDNLHGADWDWVYEAYSPWVEHVGHRSDLTHLLDIMGGETSVGHSFTGGGDRPDVDEVPIGLLGADLELEGETGGERYRIARIYTGENWNPELRAPLAAPGIDVREGDLLIAVDGVDLTAPTNPHSLFEGTAERQTVLTLRRGDDEHDVTVVPVANERLLRRRRWIEDNRRKVDELSGGRLAYVWLPNTAGAGYTQFNRYYFAQQDKQGAVIDERYNGGGYAADWVVDLLSRKLQGFFNNPVGENRPFTNPGAGIWGPKVMIVNELAGSGGDLMPWMFRNMGIGPLVGTRTWGGLVGIWDVPPLVDGGFITAPRGGFFTEDGWAVENEGVAPDIEVEMTPKEVIAGGDPQLEAAVAEALRLLEEGDWPEIPEQPADPVRALRPE